MKSLLKSFFVAAVLSVGAQASAQTWSFDVAEWSCSVGGATIDAETNTIKATEYQWGCVGLVYEGTKTVSTSQNRLCIMGKYLSQSDNKVNPNINNMVVGQSETEIINNDGQLRAESVNDRQTLIVFNVSEKLTGGQQGDYEADGTIQVRKMGFYINQTKVGNDEVFFVIDNVQFLTEAEAEALAEEMANVETAEYTWDATTWQMGENGAFTAVDGVLTVTDCGELGTDLYYGDDSGQHETTVMATNYYLNIKGTGLSDGTLDYMNIGGFEAFSEPIVGEKNSDGTRITFPLKDVFEASGDHITDGELSFQELLINLTGAQDAVIKEINFISQSKYDLIVANENALPFQFVDSLWSCTCGSFEIDSTEVGNKIIALGYQWGCLGIEFNGSALVSADKPYVVVKGKYIFPGGSNPNIYEVDLDGTKVTSSQLRMEVNVDSTICYYNISSLFTANEELKRTDGYFVLNKIGMYLQEPKTVDEETLMLEVDDVMFLSYDELQALLYDNVTIPDYAFTASDWSSTVGTVTADDELNTLIGSEYTWGCAGILNKTAYLVDTTKDYLVVRGTNLQQGTSNPCIYALEFSGIDMLGGYKPLMTSCLDSTLVYISMKGFYESESAFSKMDENGKLTLTQLGFYLQEAKESADEDAESISFTITDITFMTSDELTALIGGSENGIATMNFELRTMNYYDLQGRRIADSQSSSHRLTKGIYIIGGKKIIIK